MILETLSQVSYLLISQFTSRKCQNFQRRVSEKKRQNFERHSQPLSYEARHQQCGGIVQPNGT